MDKPSPLSSNPQVPVLLGGPLAHHPSSRAWVTRFSCAIFPHFVPPLTGLWVTPLSPSSQGPELPRPHTLHSSVSPPPLHNFRSPGLPLSQPSRILDFPHPITGYLLFTPRGPGLPSFLTPPRPGYPLPSHLPGSWLPLYSHNPGSWVTLFPHTLQDLVTPFPHTLQGPGYPFSSQLWVLGYPFPYTHRA